MDREISEKQERTEAFIKKPDAGLKVVFFSVVAGMIASHGRFLFNKLSWHDDAVALNTFGWMVEVGRWGLKVMERLSSLFWGQSSDYAIFSMPLMGGFYMCLFLTGVMYLIVRMFSIRNTFVRAVLSLLFVSCPFFCTLFAHNFVVSNYCFAFFLSVLAAYLICCHGKWYAFLSAVAALTFTLGIYQAFLAVTLTLILMFQMKEVADGPKMSWRAFFSKGLYYIVFVGVSVVLYLLFVKLFLYIYDVELVPYQHVDKMGTDDIRLYVRGIGKAYSEFFSPEKAFPLNSKRLYGIALILLGTVSAIRFSDFGCEDARLYQMLLLYLLFPACVDFVYIMCPHMILTLTIWFGHLMVFVLLFSLMETARFQTAALGKIRKIAILCFVAMILMFVRIDNIVYLQGTVMQARGISYFTTLVSQIRNTKGYKAEYPVAFLNELGKRDGNVRDLPMIIPEIPPFWKKMIDSLNDYSWKDFIDNWCAFRPKTANGADFENLPEVRAMPHYPDDGAIKVINGTVVVKF